MEQVVTYQLLARSRDDVRAHHHGQAHQGIRRSIQSFVGCRSVIPLVTGICPKGQTGCQRKEPASRDRVELSPT